MFALLNIVAPSMAYTHTIYNTTTGEIRVKLKEILCKNDNITLQPGETQQISVAGCMTSAVEARGLSGPVAGKSVVVPVKGNKAAGYEWYVNLVDFKTSGTSIVPGSGRLDIEQR